MGPPATASPFAYLDLPPTPQINASSSHGDDLVLPHIARFLMEENDIDDELTYQMYADHPAVLFQAQQPFAQILSDAASDAVGAWPCNSPAVELFPPPQWATAAVAAPGDDQGNKPGASLMNSTEAAEPNNCVPGKRRCTDAVSMAFSRGVEEASKFLPRDMNTVDGTTAGRRRRLDLDADGEAEVEIGTGRSTGNHVALPPPPPPESAEETAAREMLDKLMISGYDAQAEARRGATETTTEKKTPPQPRRRGAGARHAAVDLHAKLISCAEAVAGNRRRAAAELLRQIRRHSSPTGTAAQRLAHCFAGALEARLAGTGILLYRSLSARRASAAGVLRAYRLGMATCNFLPVQLLFSNETVRAAAAGSDKLHVVHYGLGHGLQWPDLLQRLARREGGPPEVRFTGVDAPQPGFNPAGITDDTGRRLADCARRLGVPFKFHGIAARSEDVRPEHLDIDGAGEVLVVNRFLHFRSLMDESVVVDRPNPRDTVLGAIGEMRPRVFVHAVVNGDYSAAIFTTRFRAALHNYAALFDMLEATAAPRGEEGDEAGRMAVEQEVLARWAVNTIACEGADRVERAQTYRQWHARCRRAGLRQLPLDPGNVEMVREKVRSESHECSMIDVDDGWLLHGWKGRVLYAISTWNQTTRNNLDRYPQSPAFLDDTAGKSISSQTIIMWLVTFC